MKMVESNRVPDLYSRLRNRLLNSRKTKLKKLSPLAILTILGIVVGSIGAVWYWSSNPITMTVSVSSFNINAKANVNPLTSWIGEVKVPYVELVETAVFFDGSDVALPEGPKYIFVRIGNANVDAFYTKVTATRPAGMFVTCEVCIVDRRDIGDYPDTDTYWWELGTIATDGSQSIQLIANGDPPVPLYMLLEPDSHMRYAMYRFTVGTGNLPPGTHTLSVEIHIGDTIDGS